MSPSESNVVPVRLGDGMWIDTAPLAGNGDRPTQGGMWPSVLVLARHRVVVVGGMVATLVVGVALAVLRPPVYRAEGSMLLLPPARPQTVAGQVPFEAALANPYLQLGKLGNVGEVLVAAMAGDQPSADVAARGGAGSFVLKGAPTDAPIVLIEAVGETPDAALATYEAVTVVAGEHLQRLQTDEGAPEHLTVRAAPVTRPSQATKDAGNTIRALIAIAALGLAATVLAAFAAESVSQHRASRNGGHDQSGQG